MFLAHTILTPKFREFTLNLLTQFLLGNLQWSWCLSGRNTKRETGLESRNVCWHALCICFHLHVFRIFRNMLHAIQYLNFYFHCTFDNTLPTQHTTCVYIYTLPFTSFIFLISVSGGERIWLIFCSDAARCNVVLGDLSRCEELENGRRTCRFTMPWPRR